MDTPRAEFRSLENDARFPLTQPIYQCPDSGSLLEVVHSGEWLDSKSAEEWKKLFESRRLHSPGPYGSGVWRYHEWVLPDLPSAHIVSLGEGGAPLVRAERLGATLGIDLLLKQCGHTHSGSFKDLGMTALISQVNHMQKIGVEVRAVACASTGDTSAALAAYGAAAGLRTLVLLPRGKVSAAQLVQPLACGARVIAIDSDFDGCMKHVQRLVEDAGVYLANSKNSLRIEGQKTVAFEIAENLAWEPPDWVVVPGGNLGNVSALGKGFRMLREAGLIDREPRLVCAQTEHANPLYTSYKNDFAALTPVTARATQASAIRIGNPVSFPRAVRALKAARGVVESVSEGELAAIARDADSSGLYVCPHTAVALGAVRKLRDANTIKEQERVVVVSTAHGLKFTEFKVATVQDTIPGASLGGSRVPIEVDDDWEAVRAAALAPD